MVNTRKCRPIDLPPQPPERIDGHLHRIAMHISLLRYGTDEGWRECIDAGRRFQRWLNPFPGLMGDSRPFSPEQVQAKLVEIAEADDLALLFPGAY